MKRTIQLLAIGLALLTATTAIAAPKNEKGKQLPAWQEGYLDIHHISTGRGSAAYYILPDGTQMIVDAGDLGDHKYSHKVIMSRVPSSEKRPAEWIADYVHHFAPDNKPHISYALLTHFDSDHIGTLHSSLEAPGKPYRYTGITHLGNLLDIELLVDRGYPDYDYPAPGAIVKAKKKSILNYFAFIKEREEKGLKNAGFAVGRDDQFVLKTNPGKYPTFRIMNIAGNGKIWSGKGNEVTTLLPTPAQNLEGRTINENRSSCVFRLEYGNFAFYAPGDIGTSSTFDWQNVQARVAPLVGKVDVALAEHHGYTDSMCQAVLDALKPEVVVIPVWDFFHPQPITMRRICQEPDRMIFATGMAPGNMERLGRFAERINGIGHIVIRVYEGGKQYRIFVLDDSTTSRRVLYTSPMMTAVGNKQ